MRKIERLWKVKDGSSERSREIEGCRGEREAARASGHAFPESPRSAKWIPTHHLKSSLRCD